MLADWLVGQLVGSVVQSIGLLVAWSNSFFVCRLVVWLIGLSFSWLVDVD